MTTQIEAMKMMAEALECYEDSQGKPQYVIDALAAGRAAIEAAEKVQPAAWMIVYDGQCMGFTPTKETDLQVPVFTNPPSAEIDELRKDATKLRSVLNEFDNPYQIGDVWQWIGPTPETVDAALEKQP